MSESTSVSGESAPKFRRSDYKRKLTFQTKDTHDSDEHENNQWAACNPYDSINVIAERFVGNVITEALDRVKNIRGTSQEDDAYTTIDNFESWPSICAFTVELGQAAIEDYISSWYYEENWIYNIELVLAQSDDCSDYYIYETKWGIPTKSYPVPQATASIFFTIDVSRVKPPECPINVTYQFEGCSYKHVPFKHTFDEEWLFRIVEVKLRFFQSLRF